MSAWRDNEREVALTRHARQAENRASTLPLPLKLSLSVFPSAPNWISPPPFALAFALPIVFASRVFLCHISLGVYMYHLSAL